MEDFSDAEVRDQVNLSTQLETMSGSKELGIALYGRMLIGVKDAVGVVCGALRRRRKNEQRACRWLGALLGGSVKAQLIAWSSEAVRSLLPVCIMNGDDDGLGDGSRTWHRVAESEGSTVSCGNHAFSIKFR